MAGNIFGDILKVSTFGESHGSCIGCVIEGFPSNFDISQEDIQNELNRRKPGQSEITTTRKEDDIVEILSGVYNGKTLGTPIAMIIRNKDHNSNDYNNLKNIFRPSHADYTYQMKYGIRDHRGGGRSSARETAARVAAGAIANKFLIEKLNIKICSYVDQIHTIKSNIDITKCNFTKTDVDKFKTRCPIESVSVAMEKIILQTKEKNDSIGGIIGCYIDNIPIGLGEPVFDKLHAKLGFAMLSINAVKGFEIGNGFNSVNLFGSENNDEISTKDDKIFTKTNNAGGICGGISNGERIYFKVALKPTATIKKEQNTVNIDKQQINFITEGRHDPCVLPRAVPIIDAMTALTLMDFYLINQIYGRN